MIAPRLFILTLNALILSGIFLHRAASAQPAISDAFTRHDFYFGIQLDPGASPAAKSLFFETGMNCVRLNGGGFAWAVDAQKKITKEFETRGLNVYLQLSSHYPDASYFSLTDAYMVDQSGKTGVPDRKAWAIDYSGDDWPQYSYTSLPFRQKLTQDFTSYVDKFSDNHNVAGVILHNEPGYFWQSKRLFDYNPATITAFRKWLQQQDETIAALNERWGSSYASFDEVAPPGLPPESNLASWMDWRRFNVSAVADFMNWEAGFFKTLRTGLPCVTNIDGPLNNWYGYRCANMLQYSAPMDRVGIDLYPAAYSSRDFVPYATDMVQGVAQGREAHVLECEAFSPAQWKGYDEKQRAVLLRSELWTMIGHGMNGILIWGFDTFAQADAKFNDRILACRDIAHQTGMINIRNFRRQKSRVALCVDPDSYLYDNGIEKTPLNLTSALDHEIGGFHAALDDIGVPSDVIFLDQLHSQIWRKYDAIVLPSVMMMDESTAAELRDFVSGGGMLIAAAPFAELDRWAKPQATVPAFGLDSVFGCIVTKAGLPGSISIPNGTMYANGTEALSMHGASVIGTFKDGSPAMTSNLFGKGRAILIGGKFGQPFLDGAKPDMLSKVFADILQEISIVPEVQGQKDGIMDISSLGDADGNVLVIPTLLISNGKIPVPVTNAKIVYRGGDPSLFREAFAFPPTTVDGGFVRSGPVPVALAEEAAGKSVSFHLDEIKSALPVLLAKEAGPLLATEAPQSVTNGQEENITVICYNPSSRTVEGKLEPHAGSAVSLNAGAPIAVEITPYGQKKVVLKVNIEAPAPVARVPITIVLTTPGASEIKSVPVDIALQ